MTIHEIISKLQGVESTGDHTWKARCPAHEDRTPSLFVSAGDKGGTVMHCFAGCSTDAVVRSLGLQLVDLAPDRNGHATNGHATNGHASNGKAITPKAKSTKPAKRSPGYATLVAAVQGFGAWQRDKKNEGKAADASDRFRYVSTVTCWTYRNEHGEEVYAVARFNSTEGKDYKPFHLLDGKWHVGDPPGTTGKNPTAKLPLFNLPSILAAEPSETIYVCEGEKAAEAVQELGLIATTSPHGAGSADRADWSPLAGRSVVKLPDNDAAGERHAAAVCAILANLLPPADVAVKRLPELGDGDDAFDFRERRRSQYKSDVEIREEIESQPSEAPPVADPVATGDFSNGWTEYYETEKGEEGKRLVPFVMQSLLADLNRRTDGWPRRVDGMLFVHDGQGVSLLPSPSKMFGWLGSKVGRVDWHTKTGCVTKEETFGEVCRTARKYLAIEDLPHEPEMAGHYYACDVPTDGDGSTLTKFLDRFNPATDADRDLIQAAIMTCFWGGPGGLRPCFVITSDDGCGAGKSTLASIIGNVAGGIVSFERGETASEIKTRLLSPDALTKRAALLDNIKSLKFGWGELEGLITANTISGKRMYVGEGTRPNTLTWFLTLNGASLSQDMAQRAVIINLKKPNRAGTWEEDTIRFIAENRQALIADVLAALRAPAAELGHHTRWALWERSVLAKLPEPADAQKAIEERQQLADVDQEENESIEDCFAHHIATHYGTADVCVFVPSTTAARWINTETGERESVTSLSRKIRRMIKEKRLTKVLENLTKKRGRGFIWVGDLEMVDHPAMDLVRRIMGAAEGRQGT